MKRLFFALWPEVKVRQDCVTILQNIGNKDVKPVCPDDIHVTLLFLGNIASDKESILKQEAKVISVPKLTLCFNQLSFWEKPGILCLTATELNQELMVLVDDLATLAGKLDIAIDKRPFVPHVTLFKKALAPTVLAFEPIIWQAEAFCLVESLPLDQGVKYRVIEQWTHKI